MAASANPDGNHDGSGGGGGNPNNGAAAASPAAQGLKHNPGLASDWSKKEQAILEDGLNKYASESNVVRYARIAMQLPGKTVRDVALRCRWMSKKESGKRRKEEITKKNRDKKERVTDPSGKSVVHTAAHHAYAFNVPMDNDGEISSEVIDGPIGQLLEDNTQIFRQIHANLTNHQVQENVSLFNQTRHNILRILNDMKDVPGVVKQMPPLPVKINDELANSIIFRRAMPMQQT